MNKACPRVFLLMCAVMSCGVWLCAPHTAHAQELDLVSTSPDDILDLAAEQDPSLKAVLIERRRATLLIDQEKSRYVPMFSAETGYRAGQTAQPSPTGIRFISTQTIATSAALQYTLPYGTSFGAALRVERAVQDSVVLGNLGTVWGTNLSLDVAQPWLRGFGAEVGRSGLRDAMYAYEVASLEESTRANAVASEVLNAYWQLWFLERQRDVVEASLVLQGEALKLARIRMSVGVAAEADIARLEADVAQASEEVLSVKGRINGQRLELSRLVGRLDTLPEWSTQEAALPRESVPADRDVVVRALTQSPEVKRLAQLVLRTRLQSFLAEDQARADLRTVATLSVNGIGRNVAESLAQTTQFTSVLGYVGVQVSLPLVARGLEANAERAALGVDRSEQDLRNAQNRLQAQALARHADVMLARERITLAEISVEAARRSTEIEQARYKAGDGTSFEVTQAITRQQQSELRVLSARLDERLASIELNRLMGTLISPTAP